jgi:hypothetical protein
LINTRPHLLLFLSADQTTPDPLLLFQAPHLLLLNNDVSAAGRGPEPVNAYQQAFYQYQTTSSAGYYC